MNYQLIAIIWLHFVRDFIFQTDKMAENKSGSVRWLTTHCATYTLFMIPFGVKFALINGAAHWITDFFTSRATSYLWKKDERHWFFVVIGLDQAIHMTTLMTTLYFPVNVEVTRQLWAWPEGCKVNTGRAGTTG